MDKTFTLKNLNLIFFLIMITVNMLANMLPLGHGNTGAISNKYPNLFTPAPITFSIWGVIYLLTLFFIVYQAGWMDRHQFSENFVNLVGIWFVISCVMNVGWIFSWHYELIELSMVFMIGLLVSLIIINNHLSPEYIYQETGIHSIPILAKVATCAFNLYLGWITAATIANMSVLLVKLNWSGFGLSSEFWTVVVLVVGALLGILFIVISQNYLAALGVAWAYCGILIKHISADGYGGSHPVIITAAMVGIFMIMCALILRLLCNAYGFCRR